MGSASAQDKICVKSIALNRSSRGRSKDTQISVVHAISGLHPRSGGTSHTVVQLTDALSRKSDIAIKLVSQRRAGEPIVASLSPAVEQRVLESQSRYLFSLGLSVLGELGEIARSRSVDIIHSHGLWMPVNYWASATARRFATVRCSLRLGRTR